VVVLIRLLLLLQKISFEFALDTTAFVVVDEQTLLLAHALVFMLVLVLLIGELLLQFALTSIVFFMPLLLLFVTYALIPGGEISPGSFLMVRFPTLALFKLLLLFIR